MRPAGAPLRFESPYRILFGPLYHPAVLGRWQLSPNIRSFAYAAPVRVTEMHSAPSLAADIPDLPPDARLADILAQLPPGWEPDLLIWYNVALMGLPPDLAECPCPTLGVMHDWHLNFHPCLDYAGAFDFVTAERGLLDALAAAGHRHHAFWPSYAHDPAQHYLIPGLERDWDLVFLGNLDYPSHRARNRMLERLARLGERYRVLISDRYYREDYTRLLNRSKIAFNFGLLHGETNMRAYEAAACGAMLLCESVNEKIPGFLVDGESCVLYDDETFEAKIDYYLSHDAERRRIAAKGAEVIAGHDYEHQFARLLELAPRAQAAFAAGDRQAFRQAPPIWHKLLRARHLAQCLPPGSAKRGEKLLEKREPLPPELEAHAEAVRATLILNRHWQPERLLQPGPFTSEAVQALQSLAGAVAKLSDHPWQIWHRYNLACAASLLRRVDLALPLWRQLTPQLATLAIDFRALSWLSLLPRGRDRDLHEFDVLWNLRAAEVAAGKTEAAALNRLLLWQAFELSGYCLIWVRQPEAAIQALLQAEAHGPGSYFTYAPLLQLLLQTGREAELLACLKRAVAQLGLLESLQRDLITTLLHQGRIAELKPVLAFYRQLLQCFEGGSAQTRDTLQILIPGLLSWIPELLEARLEG